MYQTNRMTPKSSFFHLGTCGMVSQQKRIHAENATEQFFKWSATIQADLFTISPNENCLCEEHLAQDIRKKAEVFFDDVYAIPGVDRKSLHKEEKDFWARYAKLMAEHDRAKRDTEAKTEVRIALGKSLPDTICWSIAAYVQ